MLNMIKEEDFVIKKSSVPGAGKGVFCKRDIPAGTCLPYTCMIFKSSELPDDVIDTYHMSVSFFTEEGEQKTYRNFVTDGNPKLACFKPYNKHKLETTAAYVNECSTYSPNCVFVTDPSVTKDMVKKMYKNKEVGSLVYLVIPEDLTKGTELFTLYGSGYNSRQYKVWRDRRGYVDNLVTKAHRIAYGDEYLELE